MVSEQMVLGHIFLVEIGTEELPARLLQQLAGSFAAALRSELTAERVGYGKVEWFATPRRLALKVSQLAPRQEEHIIENRGPALAHAFDADRNPTAAALGWAKSCGIDIAQAQELHSPKGAWLIWCQRNPGAATASLLPELVQRAVSKLRYPKPMRWGDGSHLFIRPVRSLTLMLDAQLLPATMFGVESSQTLLGHRFMGAQSLQLDHAANYLESLYSHGKVIADFQQRKETIRTALLEKAAEISAQALFDEELLDEVTGLVEWPIVLTATFDAEFLAVPPEPLVHTLQSDQRYFPLYDQQGQLLPTFLFVANIASDRPEEVIKGNERVVRPRLADAQFFFNSDRQQPLGTRLTRLETILFQQQLGTLSAKVERIKHLSLLIAKLIGANQQQTARAALLAKCDLATQMVFEFPSTQGTMGMHYARHDGEDEAVAIAIKEHYQPRFAGDAVPTTLVASAVAIADKLDTIVGIIGIGASPSGDKDPFALRRAALGILRIIIDNNLILDLAQLAQQAATEYGTMINQSQGVADEVITFIIGRLRSWYLEQGFSSDLIQAVAACGCTNPLDFDLRLRALAQFFLDEGRAALIGTNKRAANLLNKVAAEVPEKLKQHLLQHEYEQLLAQAVATQQQELLGLVATQNYQAALLSLAALSKPVDRFLDQVQIMVDDPAVRLNRLRLLHEVRSLFLQVADFSLLAM